MLDSTPQRSSSAENTGTSSLTPSPVVAPAKRLFSADALEVYPGMAGCDQGAFHRKEGVYAVRWEKQVTEMASSSKKAGTEFKHGHVKLRVTVIVEGKLFDISNVDVTMEMLPSETCATGMVQLYNFIVNRSDNDRRKIENVACSAILSMFRPHLAIFANESLEVTRRCIGKLAHDYLCKRYDLKRNPLGNAMLRIGDFLKTEAGTRYFTSRTPKDVPHGKPPSHSTATVRSSSSSGAEVEDDVIVVSCCLSLFTK